MWVIYFLAGFSGFGGFGGFVGDCVWVSGLCDWGLLGNFSWAGFKVFTAVFGGDCWWC